MTKFDYNGRINCIKIKPLNNGSIEISMEVNIEGISAQRSLSHYRMKELEINLTKATNYLVQLFYRTGKRYSCTRTKLGKLLSIVAFAYAGRDCIAFKETIYKYDDCGTAIQEIMDRFNDSEIYTRCKYDDNRKSIPDGSIASPFDLNVVIPKDYEDISGLDLGVTDMIDSVFKTFGAYTPNDLGECINPIVDSRGVAGANKEVCLKRVKELKRADFSDIMDKPTSSLIKYLFNDKVAWRKNKDAL